MKFVAVLMARSPASLPPWLGRQRAEQKNTWEIAVTWAEPEHNTWNLLEASDFKSTYKP